jgi:non-lysosomal glucosylceramidase
MQSEEVRTFSLLTFHLIYIISQVWIGVNYALASTMIYEGMIDEAFEFTRELYKTITEDIGLAFETPEALYEKNIYRSIGYMRCLSFWSILIAYQNSKK